MSDPKPRPDDATVAAKVSLPPPATGTGVDTFGGVPTGPAATPPRIGEFVLLGELGHGGMGVVYLAEDPRLKRQVAIKVMLPQFAANPQAKARFVREARAQARVEHDHVAVIHHVAEHDGLPYIVMPLLKGMTLHAALKANPRPPLPEVIRIGREVAEGLAAAHEKGLVHRDIKPANVWLEGKKLRVKVLDFGLARVTDTTDATEGSDGPVTREGAVVGTPAYMSPEQGRGLSVDGRTDLFSLGVMLYQMTTGGLPFRGSTALAILTALAIDNPPPPVTLNPVVPQALSDLVMRLLAKDPAHRPPTAEAVADELRAIEAGLVNAVRVIPLDAPPIILAPEGPDPFAELDATEANTAPDAEPVDGTEDVPAAVPVRAAKPRSGFPAWALVGGVLLVVAGVVGLVAVTMNKKPEPEVARDATPPQKGTSPSAVKAAPGPTDAEVRKALEAIHPHVQLTVRLPAGNEVVLAPTDPLPEGPFELTAIHKLNDGMAVPPNFTGWVVTALARQKSFAALQDDVYSLHWTEEEFARLAATSVRESLVGFATELDLTPKVVELLARFSKLRSVPCVRAGGADDATLAAFAALNKVLEGGGFVAIDLGKSGKVSQQGWAAVAGLPVNQLTLYSPQGLDAVACGLIARMPRLKQLTLSGATLDDAALQALSACSGLTWLSLLDCKIPPGGVRHLAGLKSLASLSLIRTDGVTEGDSTHLAGMKSLRGLNLFGTPLGTPEGAEKLQAALPRCLIEIPNKAYEPTDAHYREASRLLTRGGFALNLVLPDGKFVTVTTTLDLPEGPFTLSVITSIRGAPVTFCDDDLKRLEATPTLTVLDTPGARITEAGWRSLLASKATINNLYLANSPVTDDHCKFIAELTSLTGLNLGGAQVTDVGLKRLATLPKLAGLGVGWCDVTDIGLKHLAGLPALVGLEVRETGVSDASVETLAGMKGLFELSLIGTRISASGHKRLTEALPKCKIVWEDPNRWAAAPLLERAGFELRLKLPDGREVEAKKPTDLPAGSFTLVTVANPAGVVAFGDADIRRLGQLTGLTGIYVGNHQVTDAGLRPLLNLKETLLALNMPHGGIGDEGAKILSQLTKLQQLTLGATKLTDVGLAHLAGLTRITDLGLNALPITDAGLKHLTGMMDLKSLNLENTAVTDAAVETLAALKSLTVVNLKGTRVTDAGVKKLKTALPRCEVAWEPQKAVPANPPETQP